LVSQKSHAEEAVRRINLQRDVNLNFISSEIETLRGITIPTPQFTSYERFGKRAKVGEIYDRPFSIGSGGSVYRWWLVNPVKKQQYESEITEFATYKTNAINTINAQIEKLTQRSNLIMSKDKFTL
jgi:hypothetical protein